MASIRLKLTTQSPLLVAAGPPSHNLIETLDFIPGNTICGFLAQRYIDQKKQTGDVFHRLFLSGQIRFGFAFIHGSPFLPIPANTPVDLRMTKDTVLPICFKGEAIHLVKTVKNPSTALRAFGTHRRRKGKRLKKGSLPVLLLIPCWAVPAADSFIANE